MSSAALGRHAPSPAAARLSGEALATLRGLDVARECLAALEIRLKRTPQSRPEQELVSAAERLAEEISRDASLASTRASLEARLNENIPAPAGADPTSVWRLYCTACGRSRPLNDVPGAHREGAQSRHRYVMGWCRACRRPRWMRCVDDLNEAAITEALLAGQPVGVDRANQRPWAVIAVVALTLVVVAALSWVLVKR